MRTLLTTTLLCLPAAALADCRLEVELLATDLKGVPLTEAQKFQMAPLIDEALKRCRIQREAASLEYIAKAQILGRYHYKTVPLDDAPGPRLEGNARIQTTMGARCGAPAAATSPAMGCCI